MIFVFQSLYGGDNAGEKRPAFRLVCDTLPAKYIVVEELSVQLSKADYVECHTERTTVVFNRPLRFVATTKPESTTAV